MKWRPRMITKMGALLGVVLAIVGTQHPASAEDERSACATAAESAQALRSEHRLQEARQELLVCAQARCPKLVQTDCVQWLSEIERVMPSVVIKASGPLNQELIAVEVWIDGVKVADRLDGLARPVNPGIRQFRFEAQGMLPVAQQVVVREGEDRRLLAVQFTARPPEPGPVAPPPGHATPVVPFVLAGVGLAALGSFAYFGLTGVDERSDLASGCGANRTCRDDQVNPVRRKLLVADVSLGVSLVSLGIATYLFATHYRSRSRETADLQVNAGPSRGSVDVRLTF
jgi:hypothetical protein